MTVHVVSRTDGTGVTLTRLSLPLLTLSNNVAMRKKTLQARLAEAGFHAERFEPLAGDASARRYFRLTLEDGASAVLATYPESIRGAARRFLQTTRLLEGVGVRVPRILAADSASGWMLVEDAGTTLLSDLHGESWEALEPRFRAASAVLPRIQSLPPDSVEGLSPPLDSKLLRSELERSWDLALEPWGLVGDVTEGRLLAHALDRLCEDLGRGAWVTCHRDFMARNLAVDGRDALIVLDHQDLRMGPRFYDLASLLNDTLIPPPEVASAWLTAWGLNDADRPEYHRAALQRTLKAVGTYAGCLRRGDDRYRDWVQPTLDAASGHLAALPETRDLARRLGPTWRQGPQAPLC